MLITGYHTTDFFDMDSQTVIPQKTVVQLQEEDFTIVDEIIDFEKDITEHISTNFQHP